MSWLANLFGKKTEPKKTTASGNIPRRQVVARFDAAQTNDDNRNHWAAADILSADMAASNAVRGTLRKRSRYEINNNSYARGIIETLADSIVGTGPRLQMQTENEIANSEIEMAFSDWMEATGFAEKLRTAVKSEIGDGEVFALIIMNPALSAAGYPVALDIQLIEAEQVTSTDTSNPLDVDGVILDNAGNPASYKILKYHPGGQVSSAEYVSQSAEFVIHLFRVDRPGQHRGIPQIVPALGLFAQLRRYTAAVLKAAETAADFALVIQTDAPPEGAQTAVPFDTVELEQGLMNVLPNGWKLGQATAIQPTGTYAEFKHEIICEIARCLNMPYNVAAGNSSGYNFASGKLDYQLYHKAILIAQNRLQQKFLDRIFTMWIREYGLSTAGESIVPAHTWMFDGFEPVDPTKEAAAIAKNLENNTTNLAIEYGKRGLDYEPQLRQRAREVELCKELNLPIPMANPSGDIVQNEPL